MIRQALRRANQFVRRHGGVMVGTFTVTAGAALGLAFGLPAGFAARATVQADVGYAGSAAGIVAQVVSESVTEATRLAGLDAAGAWGLRAPAQELVTIGTRADGSVDRLEVHVVGASRQGALRAAAHLADEICRVDRERRARVRSGASMPEESGASWAELREALAALRQAHPALVDAGLGQRRALAANAAAEAELALEAAEVRLAGAQAEVARLTALVDVEASRAFASDRAARQAQAESERQEREREARAAAAAAREAGRAATVAASARVAELEAELDLLLVTRKRRHPDVRRVLRLLEAERRRAEPVAATQDPIPHRPGVAPDPARAPRGALPAGAEDDRLAAPGNLGPWRQRAPSYEALQGAVRGVRQAEVELDVARRRHADRSRRAAALAGEEDALALPRRQEASLLGQLDAVERSAPPASARAQLGPPLVITDRGTLVAELGLRRWWPAGVGVGLLLAVVAGLLARRSDRTVYELTDLTEGLGLQVLGVIPPVRSRR